MPLIDGISRNDEVWLGGRSDGEAGRFYAGDLAEWAKWDRALSTIEIAALAVGYSPSFFSQDLKWHLPMDDGLCRQTCNELAVSNYGATSSDHPRIIRQFFPIFANSRRPGPGSCGAMAGAVNSGGAQKGIIHA